MDDIKALLVESPLKACAISAAVATLGYITIKGVHSLVYNGRGNHIYPPGPPRYPVIRAMKSFPKGHFAKSFSEWGATYGALVWYLQKADD
jgi:hypothetical protein